MSDGKNYLFEFDGFRVDPVRRRLSRGNEMVPLPPKAAAILLVLLDRRGQVVPKEELLQEVWPDADVTEANLTQNVSSLRKSLGERANDPRYIITLPGQGYSFVGDVELVPRAATGEMPAILPLPAASPPAVVAAPERVPAPSPPAAPATLPPAAAAPRSRRQVLWTLAAVLALAAAVASALYLARRTGVPPASGAGSAGSVASAKRERVAVAVLGFTNLSGDPGRAWLGTALTEMLTTDLASGGKLRLISGENVTPVRAALVLPDTAHGRAAVLTRLREHRGADLIVVGSYLALGEKGEGKIRLDVQVLRAPGGEVVAAVAEVGQESDLFALVSRAALAVRRALGWVAPSAAEVKENLALRPASPEATRLYAEGLARLRAYDPGGAKDLLSRAAEADPELAVTHSALAQAWTDLGQDARAAAEAEKALRLSAPLAMREQLAIRARYCESRWQFDQASALYRSLWTFFPDDVEYGLRLANSLFQAGRYREEMAVVAALRLLPKQDDPRVDLAEAEVARQLWDPQRTLRAAESAAVKGWKQGESQRQVVAQAFTLQAQAQRMMGRLDPAIALFHQASALFGESGNKGQVARMATLTGEVLDDQGQLAMARQQFEAALALAREIGSDHMVATQLSRLAGLHQEAGELGEARARFEQAETLYQATEDPFLAMRTGIFLGQVLAAQGDFAAAQRRAEKVLATSRELGTGVYEAMALEALGQVFAVRGELGSAAHAHRQALGIAEKINDPYRQAGVRNSLAEVAARQGDLAGAEKLFELALASHRRLGTRLKAAEVQGALSDLAYRRGNLAVAREKCLDQLKAAREIGARLVAAAALQRLFRIELAEADLSGAREHLEEALRIAAGQGGEPLAASMRLDLARLGLATDRAAETVRLARDAAAWYDQRGLAGEQARALAVLAEGLLRQGRPGLAREPAEKARGLIEHSEDGELRVVVTTGIARVDAVLGGRWAEDALKAAIARAAKEGDLAAGLDARLALGAVQLTAGPRAGLGSPSSPGRDLLEAVGREAAQRGFKRVSQRAEQTLATARPLLG